MTRTDNFMTTDVAAVDQVMGVRHDPPSLGYGETSAANPDSAGQADLPDQGSASWPLLRLSFERDPSTMLRINHGDASSGVG